MKLQISTGDPLLYDFDLPLCVTFYFLGFPIQITTNSPEVLAAAIAAILLAIYLPMFDMVNTVK